MNPNPLNARTLLELADVVQDKRGPRLVEEWRREAKAGRPLPAWRMRRQLREAFRDEWRRVMDSERAGRSSRPRGQMKAIVHAFRQLDQELEAALLAADPAAMPRLAGDTIRARVRR